MINLEKIPQLDVIITGPLVSERQDEPVLTVKQERPWGCLYIRFPDGTVMVPDITKSESYKKFLECHGEDFCVSPGLFHALAVEYDIKYDNDTWKKVLEEFTFRFVNHEKDDNGNLVSGVPHLYMPSEYYEDMELVEVTRCWECGQHSKEYGRSYYTESMKPSDMIYCALGHEESRLIHIDCAMNIYEDTWGCRECHSKLAT